MDQLVALFASTLNPDLNQRKAGTRRPALTRKIAAAERARAHARLSLVSSAAEEELGRAKVQPQCVVTVLQILTQEGVDLAVRQSAAVFFKNLVKAQPQLSQAMLTGMQQWMGTLMPQLKEKVEKAAAAHGWPSEGKRR